MQEVRPSPYPSDTRARGWRFEVDMEKVKASDTWLRAKTGEIRGALMLLWGEAWQQTPCGSLPADDELVALIIDMPQPKFAKHRAILMRGWWLAEDGRLYHDTIVERVLSMLEKRAKDAERSANRRARQAGSPTKPDGVTPASHVTHGGSRGEFDTKHQAPSTNDSVPDGTAGAAGKRTRTPEQLRKSELWRAIKTLLVDCGEARDLKAAGAIVTQAITRYDEPTALAAIEATLDKRPAGVIAYLEGACQQATGLRQNKQEALEASNDDVVQRLLAKEGAHA